MGLETATYVSQLVDTNPLVSDSVGQGANHLRLIKAVLMSTFPTMTGALTTALSVLNLIGADGSSGAPALGYTADATAGFYRNSTGHQTIVGRLQGNGAVPSGSMHWFPLDPGSTLIARGGTAAGTEQYVECDGSVYASAKFPDLAASGMVVVSGSNFTMPLLTDTGRFARSRQSGTSAGAAQANENASHNHGVTDPGHTHVVSDPTHAHSYTDPGHSHIGVPAPAGKSMDSGTTGNTGWSGTGSSISTSAANIGITITAAATGITNQAATTGVTVNNAGGSEARPESFVTVCCLKA